MKKTSIAHWLGLTVLCVALAACGGGGGGGDHPSGNEMPSAATGDFSTANYAGVADDVAHALIDSANSGETLGGLVPQSAGASQATAATGALLDIEAFAARSFIRQHGHEQPLATQTTTQPCDTGHLALTATYADANTFTAGDSVTVTSVGCVLSGAAVTGSIRLVVDQFSETANGASARFSVTHNDFGTPSMRVNGTATLFIAADSTSETITLQFLGMTTTKGSVQHRWYHSVTVSANSSGTTLSYGGFHLGPTGYFRLQQLQDFDISNGAPASGVLQVSDAQGDRLKIIAMGDHFRYELYLAGNAGSVPDASAEGLAFPD